MEKDSADEAAGETVSEPEWIFKHYSLYPSILLNTDKIVDYKSFKMSGGIEKRNTFC